MCNKYSKCVVKHIFENMWNWWGEGVMSLTY